MCAICLFSLGQESMHPLLTLLTTCFLNSFLLCTKLNSKPPDPEDGSQRDIVDRPHISPDAPHVSNRSPHQLHAIYLLVVSHLWLHRMYLLTGLQQAAGNQGCIIILALHQQFKPLRHLRQGRMLATALPDQSKALVSSWFSQTIV